MSAPWTALPAPATLAAATRDELAGLAQLLDSARPGDSVHGARRRIKQLRSLLRLLRPSVGDEVFRACNGALREAADSLAGHRRAEALVAAAGKLDGAPAGPWLTLAEAHRAAHAAGEDPAAALAAARQAIGKASHLLETARPEGAGQSVAETFLATYSKARKLLSHGLRSEAADQLHEARKFVIHHLHHLKLLFPESAERLTALEALREVLGDLNDLDELGQLADAATPGPATRRMRKARRKLLEQAAKANDRLFRHKADRFAKRFGHAAEPRSRHAAVTLQAGE